jgi:S-adenosylmethionine:tRNA ribosyltransferase-isomerase
MDLADFDYPLPPAAIAQHPVEPRSAARLLVATAGPPLHQHVRDLPQHVGPGDVVVVNETKVLPARLRLRNPTGGNAEVLLLERRDEATETWEALVRPGRRLPAGTVLLGPDGAPAVEVGAVGDEEAGTRLVRLVGDAFAHGSVPLPPYITATLDDPDRYQTVYARLPGSVAAPTAGLHLTPEVLDEIRATGAELLTLDLAVGLGTFRPISSDRVEDHVMHEERYAVPDATLAACERADRVVAVGTTTLRALEAAAATGRSEGRTDLFITPGYRFRVVDVLLTNFHQPRSSLLVLLAAFAGADRWRPLYDEAIAHGYRFLSFGDAMLVSRRR